MATSVVLVYHRNPMGYSSVEQHRIYGRYFSYGRFGPSDIPRKIYLKNKDILEEAEYDKVWLEKKFGGTFPDITFVYSGLNKVDIDIVIELAHCLGINFLRRRQINRVDKRSLYLAILRKISE